MASLGNEPWSVALLKLMSLPGVSVKTGRLEVGSRSYCSLRTLRSFFQPPVATLVCNPRANVVMSW